MIIPFFNGQDGLSALGKVEKAETIHQKEEPEGICLKNSKVVPTIGKEEKSNTENFEVVLTIEKEEKSKTKNFEGELNENISALEHGSSSMSDCTQESCDRDITLSHKVCLEETQNTFFCMFPPTHDENEFNEEHDVCMEEFLVCNKLKGIGRVFQFEPSGNYGCISDSNSTLRGMEWKGLTHFEDHNHLLHPWDPRIFFMCDKSPYATHTFTLRGKFSTTMFHSNKMLIFLMWMHGRRGKTLPTWNIVENDTFSWSYVVSFYLFLWLSFVYKLLSLLWHLELTFGSLYVDGIVQNSHFVAAHESNKKIKKIVAENKHNWYIPHHTFLHDTISHLGNWDSQQRVFMIAKFENSTAKDERVLWAKFLLHKLMGFLLDLGRRILVKKSIHGRVINVLLHLGVIFGEMIELHVKSLIVQFESFPTLHCMEKIVRKQPTHIVLHWKVWKEEEHYLS